MGREQGVTLSCSNVSAGGLVWVRRPNGSWWPGRVLKRDELPAKCSIPPRSGTPIKLLGREDGSMDWYNLAKSTRIKPFRCGEFDECIEKATSSPSRSKRNSTSTGKYIRREDAILHALEIEKAYFLSGKQNGLGMDDCYRTMAYDSPRKLKKMYELDKQPGYVAEKNDILEENSAQGLSQSLVSYEQTKKLPASDNKLTEKKRRKTPNDSEENEGTKRMRDLQDIGLGVSSTRKSNKHADTGWSTALALPDSASLSESNIYDGFSSLQIKRSKDSSCLKRKRSQIAQTHESMRKKGRRQAPNKVCEGTKIIVPSYCDWEGTFGGQPSLQGVTTDKRKESLPTSRIRTDISCDVIISPHCSGTSNEALLDTCEDTRDIDSTNLDCEVKDCELASMLEFIGNDDCPDGLIDIPLIMRDNIKEDISVIFEHLPTSDLPPEKPRKMSGQGDLVSHFIEGLGESSFAGSAHQSNNIRKRTEKRSLEQRLNGKRNMNGVRFTKNVNSGSSVDGTDQSDSSLKSKIQEESFFAALDSKLDGNCFGESLTSDARGQLVKDESISEVHDIPQSPITEIPHFSSEVAKGQSMHSREQDTPSKTHMAVTTLPMQQQFPRDKVFLSTCSKYKVGKQLKLAGLVSDLFDVEVTVKSSYRGGPHVPLISLTSKLNRKEVVGHPVHAEAVEDGLIDTLLDKKIHQPVKNWGSSTGRSLPHRNRGRIDVTSLKRKYSKRKKSRLSPRKIRRLSSIDVDRKEKGEVRKPVVEKIARPAVSCVPVRLVFSRITEALTSSTRWTSISDHRQVCQSGDFS